MLSKLHNNEREKNKEPKLNMEKTAPYKRKGRKVEFSKHDTKYSSEESSKNNIKNHKDSSESSHSK